MSNLFSLEGKVALVTGSTRGLGWAMAQGLAEAGAHVVLNGRAPDAVAARVSEIERLTGAKASGIAFDTGDAKGCESAVAAIVAKHGKLDILINNAGISQRIPFIETTDADWDRIIGINLTSCFRMARLAAIQMKKQRWGRIVMISSIISLIGRPTVSGYAAAKAGLNGMTRVLAAELGPDGITTNAIAPGYFATDMANEMRKNPDFDARIVSRTPLARWAEPHELVGPVVFLASEASSFVNGHVLTVDGGMTVSL